MTLNLHAELLQRGVICTPLDASAARAFAQRWSAIFAPSPPSKMCPQRWHTFSFHLYLSLEGAAALSAYLGQWQAPFYVFDEALDFFALCEAQPYPDLSALRRDLYVTSMLRSTRPIPPSNPSRSWQTTSACRVA